MIYWVLLAIFALLIMFEECNIKFNIIKSHKVSGKKLYIASVSIILVLIAGLRSTEVGADTEMYETLYNWCSEFNSFFEGWNSWHRSGVEVGYYTLEYIISRFFSFQAFLLVTSTISIIPVMLVIYRYSKNYWYSLFMYIAFGYFSFAMGGIRQACAMGICMLAYICAKEKKLFKFLMLIAVAMCFHKSAILFVPVYWIGKLRKNKVILPIFIILLCGSFILKNKLYAILNLFSRQAFDVATDQGGIRMFALMVFTVAIGWFYYNKFFSKKKDYGEDNWTLLLMLSIAVIMWPIASVNAELNRMYYYYHIFIMLYLPNLIYSLKRTDRYVIGMGFGAVACYYLYAYIICGQLHYAPYYFFWQ